jgi:hypothetical protein
MVRAGRRGSYLVPTDSARWQEVALPYLVQFLTPYEEPEGQLELWIQWSSVCRDWNSLVSSSRIVASERLIADSSMDLRLRLWRTSLSVPAQPDSSDFTSLLLEGSYTGWAEISRDSRRTYSSILRRRPELHLQLTRILHALSTRFRDVGYCQGLNFVAGTVLLAVAAVEDPAILNSRFREQSDEDISGADRSPEEKGGVPDSFMAVIQEGDAKAVEVLTFRICERLLVRNHFILTYELGLHMRLTIWAFDKLVEALFPDLYELITKDLQVSADFYASSWFITVFSSDLDLRSSIRLLDLFIAKGTKSLHRFGLACLSHQREALLELNAQDPADGLKLLRAAAVDAVRDLGVEELIRSSVTEFKFVTNQLIADLQTAGRVHGGAQLVIFKDSEEQKHFSWLVVPLPPTSNISGDRSPGGQAAFEAAWNKDQLSIHRPTQAVKSLVPSMGLFDRMKLRRGSLQSEPKPAPQVSSAPAEYEEGGEDDDEAVGTGLTGRGHQSVSPDRHRSSEKRKKGASSSAKQALKSFGKKLGSILPSKSSSSRGYSRSQKGVSAATDD